MSTNHTPNYNLSQWEATDKVLRADFNADNAKIDAAIAAQAASLAAAPWKSTVYDRSGGSAAVNTTHIFPSLAPLNWAEHNILCAYYFFPGIDAHLSKPLTVSLGGKTVLNSTVQDFLLVFFPFRDPEQKVRGLLLCQTPRFFQFDQTYSQPLSIDIQAPQGASLCGHTYFGIC